MDREKKRAMLAACLGDITLLANKSGSYIDCTRVGGVDNQKAYIQNMCFSGILLNDLLGCQYFSWHIPQAQDPSEETACLQE